MTNLTLIQINSICIYINYNKSEQINKEKNIKENYEYLEQNINTGIFNSKDVSIAVNKIIVDFKFLFEENFKFISMDNNSEKTEKILDSALGFLREIKKYLVEQLINSDIFNSFSNFVIEKINLLGNIHNEQNKYDLYENVCIYEILEKEGLCHMVYKQEGFSFN